MELIVAYCTSTVCFSEPWCDRERLEYDSIFMKVRDLDDHTVVVPVDDVGLLSDQGLDIGADRACQCFQDISLFHGSALSKEKRRCGTYTITAPETLVLLQYPISLYQTP